MRTWRFSTATRQAKAPFSVGGGAQGRSNPSCLTARTRVRGRVGRMGRKSRRRFVGVRDQRRAELMRRGEIRLVDLDPARGSETNKRRPAVIVSNDGANATAERLGRGVITVIPVTSNVTRIFPFQVLLDAASTGLDRDSKGQAEQVRSVAVERIGRRLGALTGDLVAALDEALRLHLASRPRRRTPTAGVRAGASRWPSCR